MSIRNTNSRWGGVSRFLHWLVVALVVVQAGLGLTGKALPHGPTLFTVIGIHKSLGITILAVAALRLAWRWMNPVPALPSTLKPHEKGIARLTHWALYAILFAMPLTGWISSSAHGTAVKWFGLFEVPNLVGKNQKLSMLLLHTHEWLALGLGLVVVLHIAAALRHHFVLGDDTLRRMLPAGEASPEGAVAHSRLSGR